MDLKVAYDGTADSAAIEWFPASPDTVDSFEIYCYDGAGGLLDVRAVAAQDRTATISQVVALGLHEVEVRSFDSSGGQIESTPLELFLPGAAPGGGTPAPPARGQLEINIIGGGCDISGFPPFVTATLQVLDDGVPVIGLTENDFSITEDGRPQTIYDFQPVQGLADIVFLIDNSGSMCAEIGDVKNNVQAFADALVAGGTDFRLGLVGFGQSAGGGNPVMHGGGLTADAEAFKSLVGGMSCGGSYEPGLCAIQFAIANFSFRPGAQKHFILITDEDSDDCTVADTVSLALANNVVVHVAVDCGFGSSDTDYCNASSIRGQTGGCLEAITAPFIDLLNNCVLPGIINTYMITYESDNPVVDCVARTAEWCVTVGASSACVQCTFTPGSAPPHIERTSETIDLHNQALLQSSSPIIAAMVTDACVPFVQSASLFVRTTGSGALYTEITMSAMGGDLYQAQIPAIYVVVPGVDYYIRATDGVLNASDPSTDPDTHPYQLAVEPNFAPEVQHTPAACWTENQDLPLTIQAHDQSHWISSIRVYHRRVGTVLWEMEQVTYASPGPTDVTEVITIAGADVEGPAIEYYVEVTDDYGLTQLAPLEGASYPFVIAVGGGCAERPHPGWNWVDNQILLTGNEPTYWSALTGLPKGVSPFTILDPGDPPGRPDPEGSDERVLRGYVLAWAVNANGEEILWNHLKGDALIVDYADGSAWEYNAYAYQSHTGNNGDTLPTPGQLVMDGAEYDQNFDYLLLDFFAVGSAAVSGGGRLITVNTDLTLLPLGVDLRQETSGPLTTKANFDIWNMNEWHFSGTERCLTCWDQALLSRYDPPNHFLVENLQTDKGKARIGGLASALCPNSVPAPLLGLTLKVLSFEGGVDYAAAGMNLVGMGTDASAVIQADVISSPPPELRSGLDAELLRPLPHRPMTRANRADARAAATEKGSLLIFSKVEIRWDANGNVIQDTFLDLTNDYPQDVQVRMYFVNGDPPVSSD